MTPGVRAALVAMQDGEELVCEGLSCWIGLRRVHRATVSALHRLVAIRDVSDVKGIERYLINSCGLALIARPDIEPEIATALIAGRGFTISADHHIVFLDPPKDTTA